jgi:KDO2-lipid IV(A) lauroyltransferase|tara:strand:+ start:802 stop:1674 length:873 start_codon:yes stop_codon:yes gene_type:complete
MIKIIKYFIQAVFVYLFYIFIKIIGLKHSRYIFSKIFQNIGPLIKSKNIIDDNLYKALGKTKDEKKINIVANMWSNYGKTFVEYIYLNKFRNENLHVNITKGLNTLLKIKKNNKPVIFISGHFANFELMSMEITKKKIDLATIYRPLNNIFLNPFMEIIRKKYVCKNQIKKGISGIRNAIEYIKNNHSIALMIDQRVSEGKQIPFFNHKALTTTLPAQLALKYNCDIVPVFLYRNKNDTFDMQLYDPISIDRKLNTEVNKLQITINLNKILEEMILKKPEQWIWTHNRWK